MSNARKLADNLPINGVANAENILINGNFIVSQRGDYSSATPSSTSTYYLDRWKTDISGVSATIQNPSVDLPNGVTTKSAKIAAISSGTGYLQLHQWIEPQPYMDNRQITISAYVRSNNANTRIRVEKTGGNVDGSNTHSGGGGWELLEETITLPDSISSFRIGIIMWNGNAVSISSGDYIEMAHFKAEFGPRRTPFKDELYDTTLEKCQRYYQKAGDGRTYGVVFNQHTGVNAYSCMRWWKPMRVSPTISSMTLSNYNIYNTGASRSFSAIGISQLSENSGEFYLTTTTLAAGSATHCNTNGDLTMWRADAEL